MKPGVNLAESPSAPVTGIGVVLGMNGESILVGGIVPDSTAAAQRGIYVGDRLIAAAQDAGPSVRVESGKLAQAVALIRGPPGTTVQLTMVSADEDDSRARVVSFVRAE